MKEIVYSFIIPHRNNPDLLDRCLSSIPQRDDIQIIVVDDNSDESKRPVEWKIPGIEYVYISKDDSKGAGKARNVGLYRAKGRWLLFPDSDDYYNAGFIDILDKYKNSSNDIVYFNFEYRDGESLEILPDLPFKKYFDLYDGTDALKDEVRLHHNVPWTKMVSRDFLTRHNLQFEEVINGNDIFFSMMSGYFAKSIVVEKKQLYVYLKNINSITNAHEKPVSFYMCRITHRIKQNAFYSYLGYSGWKSPLIRIVLYCIKESGVKLLVELLSQTPKLIRSRNEWIELIK